MTNPQNTANDYEIPAQQLTVEYIVKKSRFIAWACPAPDRATAMQWLSKAREAYPDARHHCWAYQIGPPKSPTTAAMSDDGEPSGTAGKPILNVLQHKDVGDVMVIVIRYFGGIKLGAGGLVRAYSHATQMAMEQLTTVTNVALKSYQIAFTFENENLLRRWLSSYGGEISTISYRDECHATCSVPIKNTDTWLLFCARANIQVS